MIELLVRIFDGVALHMWIMAAIVLAGLVLLMSGDFSLSNIIFALIVLIFLAAAFAVIASVRRAIDPARGQKEP